MLEKLFGLNRNSGPAVKEPEEKSGEEFVKISSEDYQRYQFYEELIHKIFDTEAALHNVEDPLEIAVGVMKAACDLYQADWSGILIADLHSQLWRPEIWYEVKTGAMKETLFHEFEMTEEYVTWVQHLTEQKPLIIRDIEEIRETSPLEYESYKRLETQSVLGVPFGQHPLGFMVVRNPRKNIDYYQPLQIACFVAMMMVEQKRRQEAEKRFKPANEPDDGKVHIRYNILGPHSLEINGRRISEHDLERPNRRGWIILLYLVLRKGLVETTALQAEQWPDEEDAAFRRNTKQAMFRLHSDLAVYHDVKVIDAGTGFLKISDGVRIKTDADEMEELYYRAKSTADEETKLALLKEAFALYKGRVFETCESEMGTWMLEYMTRYSDIFINITKELLTVLGHRRDDYGVVEYGSRALRIEPGIQDVYYWLVQSANHIGNTTAREKYIEAAQASLTEEEYERLMNVINLSHE